MNEEEEVTEKGVISITPEPIKPSSAARRNSTSKANSDGVPHYLRASTGSCHDFCKYGRKHDSETKKRRPVFPSFLGNNRTASEEAILAKAPVLGEREKKPQMKLKQPRKEVSVAPKVIKKKGMSPAPNTLSPRADESSEDMLSITSIEHTPAYEEPVSVKLMIPSPCIALDEHGSIEEPGIIEPMTPLPKSVASPQHSVANQTGRSSKKPISLKAKTSPSLQQRLGLVERSSERSITRNQQNPLPIKKAIVPASLSPSSRAERSALESMSLKLKSLSPIQKSISTVTNPENEGSSRAKVIKQKKIEVSAQPNIVKGMTRSPFKRNITTVAPKQSKQKSPSSIKKTIAYMTPKTNKQKSSSPPKGISVSAKPAISLRSKTAAVKSTSSAISSRGQTADRTEEKKILRAPKASLSSSPVNRVSSMKLRRYGSTLPASPLKSRGKATNRERDTEIVKEKTLYVIEPKQEKINLKHVSQKSRKYEPSPSSRSSSSSSPSSSPSVSSHGKHKRNGSDSGFSEASRSNSENRPRRSKKPAVVSKVDSKPRLRRTPSVSLEDKPPSPHKLKFRRGKVVNLQPEINGPRRLRFRPARAVSENQNEVMRRSFRKKTEMSDAGLNPPPDSEETPAIVLRHQDVQDKKDSQGLFNHVIEETAIKLAETRKSKVKALVGAFETVISLQEK